ncbi:RusA family crossover junction endodeoxyribonuclease [Ligilactobacillus acidipiscis]|nr:RusA family crossover junction endodeoxyribonuclease [Ligilactobacillus acidipiscis]GAW63083.1 Holliday junction resolvase [Ligilactobacillus acidipiscis]
MRLVFEIEPVAQARPRAVRMGRSLRMYDPKKTADFKKQLHLLAEIKTCCFYPRGIKAEIWFYRAVQKSISKKEHLRRTTGQVRPTVNPDTDNYIKSTLDALNGILWRDDSQIVDLTAHKFYSDNPRIEIELEEFQ